MELSGDVIGVLGGATERDGGLCPRDALVVLDRVTGDGGLIE